MLSGKPFKVAAQGLKSHELKKKKKRLLMSSTVVLIDD